MGVSSLEYVYRNVFQSRFVDCAIAQSCSIIIWNDIASERSASCTRKPAHRTHKYYANWNTWCTFWFWTGDRHVMAQRPWPGLGLFHYMSLNYCIVICSLLLPCRKFSEYIASLSHTWPDIALRSLPEQASILEEKGGKSFKGRKYIRNKVQRALPRNHYEDSTPTPVYTFHGNTINFPPAHQNYG